MIILSLNIIVSFDISMMFPLGKVLIFERKVYYKLEKFELRTNGNELNL